MHRISAYIFIALLAIALPAAAFEMPIQPEPPFRTYTVSDGLNQRTVLATTQDQDGYLWVATFGGLNRFDGREFEGYTTLQGLRQNLIQALFVDTENRLWAGDAGGGLTVIEEGRVVRTYQPSGETRGVVRAITQIGQTLYVGSQPGGVQTLDLSDPDATLQPIPDTPSETLVLVVDNAGRILVISTEGMHRLSPDEGHRIELVDADITAVERTDSGVVYVGNQDGKIGILSGRQIDWFEQTYSDRVSGLTVRDEHIDWVFLEGQGMTRFGDASDLEWNSGATSATPAYDNEGVLWLPTRLGLLRYLGERFRHYALNYEGQTPEVFAILPGNEQDAWFGTNIGLLHVTAEGELVNVSDQLGWQRREVRDLKFSQDGKTLWVGHIQSPLYGIDLDTMQPTKTLTDENALTVSLELDNSGVLWVGSYLGKLDRYDQAKDSFTSVEIGNGAAIYGLDLAEDGVLWFAANYRGLYRLDTDDPTAEPEQVLAASDINEEFFTHVVAQGAGVDTQVWFTSTQGGVYRWSNGAVERVIPTEDMQYNTVYAVQPLPDGTVVATTSRGVFHYDPVRRAMQQYNSEDGFTAIEGKAHAVYFDGEETLWIGTTSGVTAMDVSIPMAGVGVPNTLITNRYVDETLVESDGKVPSGAAMNRILIEFGGITMRKSTGLQFSYRLLGNSDEWSAPTTNASISYSNLAPGAYKFEVRSKLPGGTWSEADTWSFSVPTPFWRMPWFIALMIAAIMAVTWGGVQLRLRAIEHTNRRLRNEVAERTRSIESGRRELEQINNQLSAEIAERQRADALRADVEARFHQAYQNSPLGMALVNTEGLVYDANPTMRRLFWPDSDIQQQEPLISVVSEKHRETFERFVGDFVSSASAADDEAQLNMEVECVDASGRLRRIDFHPSAVRDADGQLKYIVLIAHDVTESREMTDRLAYQARFDELTGLYNRRAFGDALQIINESERGAEDAFLMFLDLDQFKVVNDTSGHAAGDELLRTVAGLIRECVREDDVIARLGGDEFGMVLRGCTRAVALQRAEAIREKIHELEFIWDSEIFRIGASIGVVPIGDGDQSINELQQVADAACYAAKDAGRNRVHLVDSESDAAHEHRGEMRWVQRLNHAIDTDSFTLFGQRIVALDGAPDQPERIEVLVRMRDRVNNRLIPPGAFLPAAERYGLQGRLDQWVVREAISVLRQQDARIVERQELWVNLSGSTVGDPKLSQQLIAQVEAADLRPGSLNFEITETAVIRRIEDAIHLIGALREMGCAFALDDFGSGLSSFGYLKRLNVNCLKIDGQFVRDIATDPTDRIFVKSIIDIAHTLGMRVVAEFVEDERILTEIQQLGSDFGQGFGIHRPEPLDNMVTLTTAIRNAGL
ncbi:MAG: EAL domain-containing protein [Pseudomonadota bacterium]